MEALNRIIERFDNRIAELEAEIKTLHEKNKVLVAKVLEKPKRVQVIRQLTEADVLGIIKDNQPAKVKQLTETDVSKIVMPMIPKPKKAETLTDRAVNDIIKQTVTLKFVNNLYGKK